MRWNLLGEDDYSAGFSLGVASSSFEFSLSVEGAADSAAGAVLSSLFVLLVAASSSFFSLSEFSVPSALSSSLAPFSVASDS